MKNIRLGHKELLCGLSFAEEAKMYFIEDHHFFS